MKRQAYLFDFDGTLVDTMGGFADIAAGVISKYHPEMSFDGARMNYLRTSGAPFKQQLEILFPGHAANKEAEAIFEHDKQDGFFRQKFEEDTIYTINSLRQRGDIACVCSNNFQTLIDKFIQKERLVFDAVLGLRDGFQKGKDHFEFIMNKYTLTKDQLTFIGDSLKDAEKAMEFGIKFIGKCGTFNRDDFTVIDRNIITVNLLKEILAL